MIKSCSYIADISHSGIDVIMFFSFCLYDNVPNHTKQCRSRTNHFIVRGEGQRGCWELVYFVTDSKHINVSLKEELNYLGEHHSTIETETEANIFFQTFSGTHF